MYHYLYRISNKKINKHYYGVRSSKILPKKDLGIKYFSSSYDKNFIEDQHNNPENYKYKVIIIAENRSKVLKLEVRLHQKYNVGVNPNFYNKVKQTSTSFDCSGITLTKEHKEAIGAKHKGKIVTAKTKELISKNHADVSKANNPMYGKVGAMKGKIAVIEKSSGNTMIIPTEEYHANKSAYINKAFINKRIQQIVICPHCGKQGGKANMTRYHFTNCKKISI